MIKNRKKSRTFLSANDSRQKVRDLYQELRKKYGRPAGQWRLWCKKQKTDEEREEVAIGAILTQRTNWRNVELTMKNLKRARLNSLRGIYKIVRREIQGRCFLDGRPKNTAWRFMKRSCLCRYLTPCGFYNQKAGYLFTLAKFIIENYGSVDKMLCKPAEKLRKELLSLKGIGFETADSILLYALHNPVFVIDEYTRRLVKKRRLVKNLDYHFLQKWFEDNLPRNFKLYQDFHALIVIDGKNHNTERHRK